ncbi:LysR family transcriptional regulator [Phenylobacterium sp.]|uniref:LysR family transcriptional regulator n=1 Tax=Phenylobacterium sp. TaxID=1871053 RepID=UPI00272F6812|nr:LysR family transcriptional regulator [Phenylobacterium sp.]MDP1598046.1 LysR family transcriptional regulator [Phenylobacterium sp.]MDP3592159.1 LysR family transcriptional regulator [Phenylobacterium sp.]
MDRYLLRYFLAIVETGNFSRAAARENVAQPTLSAGIAKLEGQLQARLFDRTNRRVHLTQAGSRFLVHARRIEHEFNLAQASVSGAAQSELLRVAVLSTIPTGLLEQALTQRVAGDESLELLEGSEREVISLLDRGRADVALTILRPATDKFASERLFEEGYGLALPSTHRLAEAASLRGEELADEVMMVRRHCEVLAETSRYFTDRNVRPAFSYRGVNDDRVMAMVRAGLGITVMPDSYREAGVARVKLEGFTPRRIVGLCYAGPAARYRTSGFVQAARELAPA